MTKSKQTVVPELQEIGKKVDAKQLLFVMEKMKKWVHFVGMDEQALAQVAGIILVAGQEYKEHAQEASEIKNPNIVKKKVSNKINLFDPATYG